MKQPNKNLSIAIAGAGSIGCFVGGQLHHAGLNVGFLGRLHIVEMLREQGLGVSNLEGASFRVPAQELDLSTSPEILAGADIIIVCVKSSATEEMGEIIKAHAAPRSVIVSLQNGVTNADRLRHILPDHDVRSGIVEFNVVQLEAGVFHKGTSGKILIQSNEEAVATTLAVPGLDVRDVANIEDYIWGKLLFNLNNALNALSGLPLKTQLEDRQWRFILARLMDEALLAMRAAQISPISQAPLPPRWVPTVLRLPTALFRMVAARMLKIDPEARSSMWEDLERRRKTEIEELQGAIVRLAQKHGQSAIWNEAVLNLVREVEASGEGSPKLLSSQIQPALSSRA